MNIKRISEKEFDEKYKLIKNHLDDNASFDGYMFETYGEELDFVFNLANTNRVITIIESDDKLFYTTGFHIVNRIGFLILETPYDVDFEVEIEN